MLPGYSHCLLSTTNSWAGCTLAAQRQGPLVGSCAGRDRESLWGRGGKAACLLSDMKAAVKHTDRHNVRNEAARSILIFLNINCAFTNKDLRWFGAGGGGWRLFFPLLLFDNKKCLVERNTLHPPKNYLEDSRMKTIAITGLSWTRETLLSLGGKLIQKLANAQVLNKVTALWFLTNEQEHEVEYGEQLLVKKNQEEAMHLK